MLIVVGTFHEYEFPVMPWPMFHIVSGLESVFQAGGVVCDPEVSMGWYPNTTSWISEELVHEMVTGEPGA